MSQKGEPLHSVSITLLGQSISAVTDEDGYFLLVAVSPGACQLEASRYGYSPIKQDTSVSPHLWYQINFVLKQGKQVSARKQRRILRVTFQEARLRASPSLAAPIIGKTRRGDEFAVLRREGDWYEIETRSQGRAWIYGGIVSTNERILYGLHYRGIDQRGWDVLLKCSHQVDPDVNTPLEALGALFELGTPDMEADYRDFRARNGPYAPYDRWWIRNVTLEESTARVRFGGDVEVITERSGTTGAQQIAAQIVFTLLQFPGIYSVYLDLEEGSHLNPGLYDRDSFLNFLPTPELETIASEHPDPSCKSLARDYLRFRKGE